jgi:hypothetical protein
MIAALESFLAAHPVDTDLRLVNWAFSAPDTLTCALEANPWWLAPSERSVPDQRIVITMGQVRSSNIALGWRPSDIEDLTILADDPHLWAHGTHGTIYGNSPVPDPARFFLDFWDLVHFELHAADAVDSPFKVTSFADWAKRVTSYNTYQLLSGPLPVLTAASRLLEAQSVEYRLVAGPERSTTDLRVVWVGESWIVCGDAHVEHPAAAV